MKTAKFAVDPVNDPIPVGQNLYKNLQFNKNAMSAVIEEDERRYKHVAMGERPHGDSESLEGEDLERYILKGVLN